MRRSLFVSVWEGDLLVHRIGPMDKEYARRVKVFILAQNPRLRVAVTY